MNRSDVESGWSGRVPINQMCSPTVSTQMLLGRTKPISELLQNAVGCCTAITTSIPSLCPPLSILELQPSLSCFCHRGLLNPVLVVRGPGFDSRLYHIFLEVVGLERGPLSLVRITEELLK
jgi:hypothetical protein